MAWGITCSLQKGGGKIKGRAVCPVPLQADYESGMGELTEIIAICMKSLSKWENNVVILSNLHENQSLSSLHINNQYTEYKIVQRTPKKMYTPFFFFF